MDPAMVPCAEICVRDVGLAGMPLMMMEDCAGREHDRERLNVSVLARFLTLVLSVTKASILHAGSAVCFSLRCMLSILLPASHFPSFRVPSSTESAIQPTTNRSSARKMLLGPCK
eukprot:2945123-Rhodomonas_salina.1